MEEKTFVFIFLDPAEQRTSATRRDVLGECVEHSEVKSRNFPAF